MATTNKTDTVRTPQVHIIPPKVNLPHTDPSRLAIEHTVREVNRILTLLWNEIAKKANA